MQGKIVEKAAFYVTGVVWTGPFENASAIPELWKSFVNKAPEIPGQIQPGTYVAPFHDRETDFTYYIGMEVEEGHSVPPGMCRLLVPVRKYAQFTHTGPMSKVQDTYIAAFQWLADHGLEKDRTTFSLEVYDSRYMPATDGQGDESSTFEIFIPLK